MRNSILLLLSLFSCAVIAENAAYKKARDEILWPKIYQDDYSTLYCGIKKSGFTRVTAEHVYPQSWVAAAVGCKSVDTCKTPKFNDAVSDLHNLYPALKKYKSSRRNLPFGEIEGEKPRFPNEKHGTDKACDFERTTGKDAVVEPREEAKGRIARSVLYMIHWYDLPAHDLLPLMVKWHQEHPPTKQEIKRQDLIEKIQGRRNPFVWEK